MIFRKISLLRAVYKQIANLCVFLENDEFYVRLQSLLIGPVTNINRSILVLSRSKKKKQIPKVDQFNETFRFQATFFARIFFFFIFQASITYLYAGTFD